MPGSTLCKTNCLTYSCMLGAPNTLGNFLFAEKHRLGENLPNIFRYTGVLKYYRQKMHYIFGIFRPLRINNVCDNFRPHGNCAKTSLLSRLKYYFVVIWATMVKHLYFGHSLRNLHRESPETSEHVIRL